MLLLLVAWVGGVLTILSPCILPVLPFVFARADRSFLRGGLPLLAGMALAFVGVSTLASVGGGWAVHANEYGRWAALALLSFFALTLLVPSLADRFTRPLVQLGTRLSSASDREEHLGQSLLLGVATGLLWAPCAGPILGLILTAAALRGASVHTTLLLLAYALGAATSLAVVLLSGRTMLTRLTRRIGSDTRIRRGLGALILLGVLAIVLGLDRGLLTRIAVPATGVLESALVDRLSPGHRRAVSADGATTLAPQGPMPALTGATAWLNGAMPTAESLRGQVVLIDFWTYSCINCLRALPWLEAWQARYRDEGLVVIGIHTPEFAFEKRQENVVRAMRDLRITWPVALDNDYALWRAFDNQYWPAHYFIDVQGRIRHIHTGEGGYDRSEQVIRTLLAERNGVRISGTLAEDAGAGVQLSGGFGADYSPETYLGYRRDERLVSPGGLRVNVTAQYTQPDALALDDWAVAGEWHSTAEHLRSTTAGGRIVYRFRARDVHMVLGAAEGTRVPFRVRINGAAPGEGHGLDVDADGMGVVTDQRLYQLIRLPAKLEDALFEIEFLAPGVEAFTFTFG